MARVVNATFRSVVVEPRPAVEATLLHVGDVVGNKIVAEAVALIGRAPELACCRVDGFSYAVAQARCVDLYELSVGRELKYVGAMILLGVGVGVVHVGVGADRGKKPGAVLGEGEVGPPV